MLPIKPRRDYLVYVSGAMTATDEYPDWDENLARICRASLDLFWLGFSVYCPATKWFDENPFVLAEMKRDHCGDLYKSILEMDRVVISRCDGLYMLKGWEASRGARQERIWAYQYERDVFYEGK